MITHNSIVISGINGTLLEEQSSGPLVTHKIVGVPIDASIWIGTEDDTVLLGIAKESEIVFAMPFFINNKESIFRLRKAGYRSIQFTSSQLLSDNYYSVVERDYI